MAVFFIFSLLDFAKEYTLCFEYPYLDYICLSFNGFVFGMLYSFFLGFLQSFFVWLKRKFLF